MVTSICVLSSLMATPHMQLRHLPRHDDTRRKPPTPCLNLEAEAGDGRKVQGSSNVSRCFSIPSTLLRTISRSATSCLYSSWIFCRRALSSRSCASSPSFAAPSCSRVSTRFCRLSRFSRKSARTSSILVTRACSTSRASIPCTAIVVSPFLPTELCTKSLAELLYNSCLDAVHLLVSQRAVIGAIRQGEGETFPANGHWV